MPPYLIVTADDFGLDAAVNEAIETAHRCGILTTASLLVGAPAAADAVARARRLTDLHVGLHLAVADAVPVLPRDAVPDLVGSQESFKSGLFRAGIDFFFRRDVRAQLHREIEAQFEAFAATGLILDHANAHKHMHLHPSVSTMMIETGKRFGLRAVRVPAEPIEPLRRADPVGPLPRRSSPLLSPWIRLLRRRLIRAGLFSNDHLLGIAWSGCMTEARVANLLPHLPDGVSEIYFHPIRRDHGGAANGSLAHCSAGELAALISPEIRGVIDRRHIKLTSFGELAGLRSDSVSRRR